jgi:Transposase IS116/IS110/IS902 family
MPSCYLGLDVHKCRRSSNRVALRTTKRDGQRALAFSSDGPPPSRCSSMWSLRRPAAGTTPTTRCAAARMRSSWRIPRASRRPPRRASRPTRPTRVSSPTSCAPTLIPEAWAPPQEVRDLRDLVRLRWRFVGQRTTARNRISNLLARQCLRHSGTDLFGRGGRAWLNELDLDPHSRALVDPLLASIAEADGHVAALTALLHERLDGAAELQLLMSIPGVGFITAATLLAELGDWRRFGTAKQVSAYFGMVPSVRASAAVAHYGRITRAGSPHARRALVEAAHVAVRLPGPLRRRYLALARRRGKKVALVAAARELLELSWILLSRGEVYRAAA